jgi:hypothetical protein
MLHLTKLPHEIVRMIFMYLQSPEAKIISDELNIYGEDHNYYITKETGYYLVKSVMSFSEYYFDRFNKPFDYDSYYDHFKTNTHKKYILNK